MGEAVGGCEVGCCVAGFWGVSLLGLVLRGGRRWMKRGEKREREGKKDI